VMRPAVVKNQYTCSKMHFCDKFIPLDGVLLKTRFIFEFCILTSLMMLLYCFVLQEVIQCMLVNLKSTCIYVGMT